MSLHHNFSISKRERCIWFLYAPGDLGCPFKISIWGRLYKWLPSERFLFVLTCTGNSTESIVTRGVPQGSVPSLTLFNITLIVLAKVLPRSGWFLITWMIFVCGHAPSHSATSSQYFRKEPALIWLNLVHTASQYLPQNLLHRHSIVGIPRNIGFILLTHQYRSSKITTS